MIATNSHKIPKNLAISSCKPVQASLHISLSMMHTKHRAWHSRPIKLNCIACSFLKRPSCFSLLESCSVAASVQKVLLNTALASPTIHNYSSFNSAQGPPSRKGPCPLEKLVRHSFVFLFLYEDPETLFTVVSPY